MIHAVGRAGAEEPRIVDFSWGREDAPKVAIIGKGVTFDTGGLDIKPASGMELMKKDMGGAATALTLARLIMEAGLDLRLRTVIPIVENAISAPAMRPGDVIVSRKGISVEVGNTDAEGRMILADALALADEDAPELMLDFATLTGAARVALGPDLPPFYTDDDALAASIAGHSGARARSRMAHAALAPLRRDDRGIGRRHQQFGHRRRHGGLDHRRALSSALRRESEIMGAFRRLRLEPEAARPCARGRRDPGGAGAVRAVERALSEAVRRPPRRLAAAGGSLRDRGGSLRFAENSAEPGLAAVTAAFTLRLDEATLDALDQLAEKTERSRSWLATKAIEDYVALNAWQIGKIEAGIAAADRGDFASDDDVERVVGKYSAKG